MKSPLVDVPSTKYSAPSDEPETDSVQAMADLDELIELATLQNFDLFESFRRFTDAGGAILCLEIDESATEAAGHFVGVYHLGEGPAADLAALRIRAREINLKYAVVDGTGH